MKPIVWIDIINPSHPLFFRPLINEFLEYFDINVSLRERGETVKLARSFGIGGNVIGKDYEGMIRKTLSIAFRTLNLNLGIDKFDIALSFENPMSVAVARMRKRKCILMLDNDLKYKIKGNIIQSAESWLKSSADHILIPEACSNTVRGHINENKLMTFDGFKEDVYIADYHPDEGFLDHIPFDDYFVIRPEALSSLYVKGKESLVPPLLERFEKEGENVILLPRDRSDGRYRARENVHIPSQPLNGLDLIHHSRGVLTGSGTMAREAALMGKPAISFFPEKELLSVDKRLIHNGWMHHSRDIDNIFRNMNNSGGRSQGESQKVQEEVFTILKDLMCV